jgi:hypothetical protein
MIILAWVLFVGYGLFIDPVKIKKTIIWLFRLHVLRCWKESAVRAGDDIVESSHELRSKSYIFRIKAFTAIFLSWTSKYRVVNAVLVDAASVGSLALAIAIIWRIISYYPYLIIGASIAPGWIQRNFVKSLSKKK